jgi:cytochrome oxidase Cu insertion factor (SCO1/SenC/PrrC family)
MRGLGISLVLAGLAGGAFASDTVGLPVGATAPAFELTDQNGETRSLASLLGSGKLAIVFFRSADW